MVARNIKPLVGLDNITWHRVTMQMAWHFRTDFHPMPDVVLAAFAGVLVDKDEWAQLRHRINLERARDKRSAARYALQRRTLHRKSYMKTYMRNRRKQEKEQNQQPS